MRILYWDSLDAAGRRRALIRPQLASKASASVLVREIIDSVKVRGDEALRELTRRFDGVDLEELAVKPEEFLKAREALTDTQTEALKRAIGNVRTFHQQQRLDTFSVEIEPGIRCKHLVRPLSAVGLYIPAGSTPLPSTVVMLAVPAGLAGCPTRIVCTPPAPNGGAHPAILVAAQLCGIDTVFKVGGAQAIAALAYGTQSIPRVDKIFGPGNAWVTAAKQQVASDPEGAACDLPAGPSEVLIVADETARAEFVAGDLLAQAEHDPLSQAILITVRPELGPQVVRAIREALPALTRRAILEKSLKACRCIVVRSLETAFEIANLYAPEHLLVQVREPRRWISEIRNAGAVFLGPWSVEALGDYCSGTNHVLPTYGHARALSGLSVRDFLKSISIQEVSRAGLESIGPTAITLAQLEGLDAHARSIEQRLSTDAPPGYRA